MGVIQNSLNSIVGSGLKVAGAMKVKELAKDVSNGAESLKNQNKSLIALQKGQEAIKNKFNTTKALDMRLKQLEASVGHIGIEDRKINEIDATRGFGNFTYEVPNREPTDEEIEFEKCRREDEENEKYRQEIEENELPYEDPNQEPSDEKEIQAALEKLLQEVNK